MRQHLVDVGGMDFVQGIFKQYKNHLKSAGIKPLPSRGAMDKYIWMANKLGLIVFDHAAEVAYWDGLQDGVEPAPGYIRESRPQAPSPRHYYRIINPQDPRWDNLEGSYRVSVGLPRVAVRKPKPVVEAPAPPVEVAPPPRKPGRPPKVAPIEVAPKPAKPAKVPRKPAKVKVPAFDISSYETKYEEIRSLAAALVEDPYLEAMDDLGSIIESLKKDIRENTRSIRGPARLRLGDITDRLVHGGEDLEALRAAYLQLAAFKYTPQEIDAQANLIRQIGSGLDVENIKALIPKLDERIVGGMADLKLEVKEYDSVEPGERKAVARSIQLAARKLALTEEIKGQTPAKKETLVRSIPRLGQILLENTPPLPMPTPP